MARKLIEVFAVPEPEEVAARIRAERERLGLSQSEVARKLGVGYHSYRQLEVRANPQLSTLFSLAREAGMDIRNIASELFGQ